MPLLRSINRFLNIFHITFSQFGRWSIWWPLLLYGAVKTLLLIAAANYTHPIVYSIAQPYLSWIGSIAESAGIVESSVEQFSHYPSLFALLPIQFEWLSLPYGVLFEGLALGLAAKAFSQRVSPGKNEIDSNPISAITWFRLIVIWLALYLLVTAVSASLSNLLQEELSGAPRRIALFDTGMYVLSYLLLTPFALAIPLLGIAEKGRGGLGYALKESLRIYFRYPLTLSAIVVLPPLVLLYPLILLNSPVAGIAQKLRPEFSFYVLLGVVVISVLVNFIYSGTVTRLALEERRS